MTNSMSGGIGWLKEVEKMKYVVLEQVYGKGEQEQVHTLWTGYADGELRLRVTDEKARRPGSEGED